MSAQSRVVNALAAHLAAGGVRELVVSPGARNIPLVLAFAAQTGVRLRVVLDERSAGFLALGLARASGRPVALTCTSGSAAAHYLPAVIEAAESGLPLLVLSADRPVSARGTGAWQTVAQAGLLAGHCRLVAELAPPAGLSTRYPAQLAARLLDAATRTPGPVHLNLPLAEPLWDPAARALPEPARPLQVRAGPPHLPADAVEALAGRLRAAERGILWCGAFATPQPGFPAALAAVAGRLGWPLLAELGSGLRCGRAGLPLVSCYETVLKSPREEELRPDLVLRFGQTPSAKPLLRWLSAHAPQGIAVDPHGRLRCPDLALDELLVADPTALCRALAEQLPEAPPGPFTARWLTAEEEARAALRPLLDGELWEGALAAEVLAALPDGAGLHVANSMPVRDLNLFGGRTERAVTVYTQRGANGIDGTLASAAGESLAHDGPFTLLTGDLSFLHDASSLLTAKNLGARLRIVVVDNGGGGIFGFLPIAGHPLFERCFLTPQPVDIVQLCGGYGVPCAAVDTLPGLRAALARPAAGLDVLVVRVDRERNLALHRQAAARLDHALSGEGKR